MTVESCVSFCNGGGYIYAGLEYAQECYCGNTIGNGGAPATASDCDMACTVIDDMLIDRLSMYKSSATPPAGPITVPSVGDWISLGCYSDSVNARTLTVEVTPTGGVSIESCTAACQAAGYPLSGAEYADECYCGNSFSNGGAPAALTDCDMACAGNGEEFCGGPDRLNVCLRGTYYMAMKALTILAYCDNANGRVFTTEIPDNTAVTVESCISTCSSQGFTLAGLEYSVQCFCGDSLVAGAVTSAETDCNMACGGAATEACGGPNRLSVYTSTGSVTAYPVPVAQTTGLPGAWEYQGCLEEPGAVRVFPYQIIYTTDNTPSTCLSQCSDYGYPAGGMEYGDECWCGDVSDTTASPGFATNPGDCSMPCSGDPIHLCGGPQRLQYYKWNGNLNVWNTPANTGQYEFLIGGVVVPLVVTLGINNKIAMVEKFGTSEFDNSTGAYELDLSLVGDFNLAWRTMHVKSDVFCSASLVLPDKGARQLNIGGWSLDSTQGVRLYTPDGSPGVNGTNDWEENYNELHLQRQRWYPSGLVLSNGSVLVVGGEVGSNGAPEPSLEILPTPVGGPTWKFLDYLNRTDPNNLYPYLIMLPSGRVFIGYYNEARILDPNTLDTDVVLPNMPGSVTSDIAGRTYPMEGSAVILPQYPPYTDPVTILICGGSNFGIALDNCVNIQPEVANPTWTIERMPSKPLPDGTYLILNGAQAGVAGFGLGSDPNYNAILYDPTKPVSQRFSILADTIVARMYHSEATLLYDGRVLVSGSDPQTPGLPEEMRIEVYIPPYLSSGLTQPSFTVIETDWAYGGSYQITVTLHQGGTNTMKVSLIAATSSTHGNAMGIRTIFPEFSCNGNTCTVVAPPNSFVSPPSWYQLFILDGPTPSHSNWVRIGGDPGRLGDWPNFPDFTLPGV
ncbi:hypothetical protein EW026_g5007 [Hermanssonia centrifuga]|uniref:WSC domain-containing protein n=1 Tax=Hermanssonia centrifuga TaxID=98765 RepID=A0A4S4KFU2_9APHY|nr:hypothetical protein EW026_g5007 [Hermanssonia centrifuga]